MYKAQQIEAAFVADLPKREKSRVMILLDAVKEITRVEKETESRLYPQAFAARLLNVSPQRVNELVDLGRLTHCEIPGVGRMVFLSSITDYAKTERKAGRPRTFKECMDLSRHMVGKSKRK